MPSNLNNQENESGQLFIYIHYAHAYCRISSYLQTMANRGYNPLIAIQIALTGKAASIGRE